MVKQIVAAGRAKRLLLLVDRLNQEALTRTLRRREKRSETSLLTTEEMNHLGTLIPPVVSEPRDLSRSSTVWFASGRTFGLLVGVLSQSLGVAEQYWSVPRVIPSIRETSTTDLTRVFFLTQTATFTEFALSATIVGMNLTTPCTPQNVRLLAVHLYLLQKRKSPLTTSIPLPATKRCSTRTPGGDCRPQYAKHYLSERN